MTLFKDPPPRAFYRHSEAWYAATQPLPKRFTERVSVSVRTADAVKELQIDWEKIGPDDTPHPRLKAFGESWGLLFTDKLLNAALRQTGYSDPDTLCRALAAAGFVDATPRAAPTEAELAEFTAHTTVVDIHPLTPAHEEQLRASILALSKQRLNRISFVAPPDDSTEFEHILAAAILSYPGGMYIKDIRSRMREDEGGATHFDVTVDRTYQALSAKRYTSDADVSLAAALLSAFWMHGEIELYCISVPKGVVKDTPSFYVQPNDIMYVRHVRATPAAQDQ